MLRLWLILVMVSLNYSQALLHQMKAIENLVDEHYGPTTIILGFLCNRQDSMLLLKTMSRNNHQVNILPLTRHSLAYPLPPNHILYILDLKCSKATTGFLDDASKEKLFSQPFKWLVYSDESQSIDDVKQYFFNVNILVDSDVLVIIENDKTSFNLKKIFKPHMNSPIIIESIGSWSMETGLNITMTDTILARRRRDLMGITLKSSIVITNNDSLNHLTDKRDSHIDSIAKVNYVLVKHLSDIVNASLSYTVEDSWGYENNVTHSWSGMIGKLTRNEADIGGTALFLTSNRIHIIDYIAMTTPTRSKFIFRQPKLSYVTNVFVLPFDRNVWDSTIASLFVIALVLYVVVKWEWKKKKIVEFKNESNSQELHDSWLETLFISFGAMCQQGASSTPYSSPGRITMIFLFVSFMFLYTSYAANIVALLQSSSTSIQTLEDILNSRLEIGVDDTVFNHFYFPNATERVRRAIYLKKVKPPGQKERFYSIEEGIAKMRAGLFAFHVETGPAYKIVSETFQEGEKCGLKEIEYLQVPDPWLAIQKNSSYKEMLKTGLHQLQENGIQAREVGLIYTKKPQCLSRGSVFVNVGLVDCYAALVILVGGIILAALVFIVEIYFKSRVKSYEKKIMKLSQGRLNRKRIVEEENPKFKFIL